MPLTLLATSPGEELRLRAKRMSQSISRSSYFTVVVARFVRAFFILAVIIGVAPVALRAQQPASPTPPDAPSSTRRGPAGVFETVNRRSLFFPDLATNEERLSTGEKFKLFVNNSASLSTLVGSAFDAAIGQLEYSPHGYPQGPEGYGKRFGASMARNASNEFFGTFVLASILHQDPRFFPEANPTLGGSVKYAVKRVFVTRNDDGDDTVNWSGLIGPAMGEVLANVYWPEGERTAGDTLQRYGIDIASRAGFNFLRNYWPVMFKKLRRPPKH
jgi:hypothetical protein